MQNKPPAKRMTQESAALVITDAHGKVPDAATAREQVKGMVRASAVLIVKGVIEAAKKGQLAQVKYLFEMAGVHPPEEQSQAGGEGESLAQVLLRRLNLPSEPVTSDKESTAEQSTNDKGDCGDCASVRSA